MVDGGSAAGDFFAPVEAAAGGEVWPRWPRRGEPSWSSQFRRVYRAVRLLGLDRDPGDALGSEVAGAFGVSLIPTETREKQSAIRWGSTFVVDVLGRILGSGRCRWHRLLRAGHLTGIWGEPFRVTASGRLRSLAFPRPERQDPG